MTFAERAEILITRGIPVIPVNPGTKRCTLLDWNTLATTDPAQIEAWQRENPSYNTGAVGQRDGNLILDIDDPEIYNQLRLARIDLAEIRTFKVTGSKHPPCGHYYFRQGAASNELGNCDLSIWSRETGRKLRTLFDVKGNCGYVVGPHSIHPDGKEYLITEDSPIAQIPDQLVAWLAIHRGTIWEGEGKCGPQNQKGGESNGKAEFSRPGTLKERVEAILANCLGRGYEEVKGFLAKYGYYHRHEADSAIAAYLFVKHSGDYDKAAQEFQKVRLHWERGESYNRVTLGKAKEWYDGSCREEARNPQRTIGQAADVTELDGPDGLHVTSIGNAERFLRDYRSDVLWVEGSTLNSSGTFYIWDGQHWQSNNVRAMLLAKETVSNLKNLVAQAIAAGENSDRVKSLAKFWNSCESDHQVREILSLACWHVVIKQGEFDSDPDLLGVRNGVVDLRRATLRTAMREDHITKQANVTFDPHATCPLWEKFLLETTDHNHEYIAYLAQCAGISLTGHTKEHLFFVIVGLAGTGKTTFCETIKYVWGDYCIGIDPNSLAASMKAEGGRARPDIARLPGVRLAFANETRQGLQLDAGLVKALTGGDTIQARHLYQAEFDFKPTHKLWLRTNYEPQFDGADTGMQRRAKKLPFNVQVKAPDPNLPEKLQGEAAGILYWAIRGLMSYQKHGLIEPTIVQSETAEYIKSLDVVAQFIEEECQTGPFIQPSGELYNRYRAWVDGRGQKAVGQPRFNSDLQAKGFRRDKDTSSGNKYWYGLRLTGGSGGPGGKNRTFS